MTCDTQFRVTRAELVGTIVACPKCGSMMQIVAPDEIAVPPTDLISAGGQVGMAVGQESVDSEAMTEASNILGVGEVDFADSGPSDPGASASSGNPTTRARFEVDESIAAPAAGPAIHDPAATPPLPMAFESAGATRSRQIALVVLTLISGLCVSGLLFFLFVRSWDRQTPASNLASESVPLVSDDPNEPAAELDPQDTPATTDAVDGSDDFPPVTEVSATNPESGSDPTVVPDTSSEQTRSPDEVTSAEDGDDNAQDPPDIVAGIHPPDDAPPAQPLADLAGLDPFKPFLIDLAAPAPDAPPALAPIAPREDEVLDAAADGTLDPMMIANPPQPINTRQSLAIEFALHRPSEYPLADYLLLISQLTGVPIDIDWVSLDLAGVDVRRPIRVVPETLSTRDHLASIAKQIGGRFQEEETLLRLTIDDAVFDSQAAILVDTEDFAEHKSTADELLIRFVGEPTIAGEADDGNGEQETTEQPPADPTEDEYAAWIRDRSRKQLAIVATESLRRMREVPVRIPDAIMRRWSCGPTQRENESYRWSIIESGETGDQPITAMPIAQWLSRTARRNDSSLVIHWTDASKRQMSPGQLVLPHVGDGFLSMSENVLSPFEVQLRKVDDGYWWLGTDARYDWLSMVVWTEPMDEARRNQFVTRLDQAMTPFPPGTYRRVADPISNRLLIMLPRFMVRQLDKLSDAGGRVKADG